MDHHKSSLERAFELAKDGSCTTIDEIRRRLRLEGYNQSQIQGPQLQKQLRALIERGPSFSPER
jgi:hypothetical protein